METREHIVSLQIVGSLQLPTIMLTSLFLVCLAWLVDQKGMHLCFNINIVILRFILTWENFLEKTRVCLKCLWTRI